MVFPRHFARGFDGILVISIDEDPLSLLIYSTNSIKLNQTKLLLQTFSVTGPSSFIFSQCPDFLSYFLQLLLDFLAVWSGVKAVVVIIHIAVSFLRRFNRRVGKCCDKVSEQDNSNKVFHLNSYEQFWERTWSYNGTEKFREKMIQSLPQSLATVL